MCLCQSVCTGRRLFSPWLGRHAGIFDLFYTTKLKNKFNGFGGNLDFSRLLSWCGCSAACCKSNSPPCRDQSQTFFTISQFCCDTMGFSLRGFAVSPLSGLMSGVRERSWGGGGSTGSDQSLQIKDLILSRFNDACK